MKKFGRRGIVHWIAPVVIVVLVGLGGVYFIVASHAATDTAANNYGCTGRPLLVEGSSNHACVKYAQHLLNLRDGAGLNVDGIFGSHTLSAVKAFQRRFSLGVDGKIGSCTWSELVNLAVPISCKA